MELKIFFTVKLVFIYYEHSDHRGGELYWSLRFKSGAIRFVKIMESLYIFFNFQYQTDAKKNRKLGRKV